jgi:hypothetical protein
MRVIFRPKRRLATADHAPNLFALLFYVREVPNPLSHALRVQRWLVFRCWPKILSRLKTSQRKWETDPIETLCNITHVEGVDFKDEGGLQLNDVTSMALVGIPQIDGKCYVNVTTASMWANRIGILVDCLRSCLSPVSSSKASTPHDVDDVAPASLHQLPTPHDVEDVAPASSSQIPTLHNVDNVNPASSSRLPTPSELDDANWALLALEAILRHGPVKKLFVNTGLAKLFKPKAADGELEEPRSQMVSLHGIIRT